MALNFEANAQKLYNVRMRHQRRMTHSKNFSVQQIDASGKSILNTLGVWRYHSSFQGHYGIFYKYLTRYFVQVILRHDRAINEKGSPTA